MHLKIVLKFGLAIVYQIFTFSPNDNFVTFKNYKKYSLFHQKSSFRSQDIQTFVIFSLPFHIFRIQKDKWKWNNL